MTLNGHYALYCTKHAYFGAHDEILMKIDPYYQQQKCSPMTLVFGNIRFMRIFADADVAGVPLRGVKQ